VGVTVGRHEAATSPPNDGDRRPPTSGTERDPPAGSRTALWIPAVVLIVGLLITAILADVSREQYLRNESRLLRLRVHDAGALVAESVLGVETPLARAASFAAGANGNVSRFDAFVAADVGHSRGQFVSISLLRSSAPRRGPITTVGTRPRLMFAGARAAALFKQIDATGRLGVIGLLGDRRPGLGFAFESGSGPSGYVVYGERLLPADRQSRYQSTFQFADLNYAIYLGPHQLPQNLLVSDVKRVPLRGTHTAEAIPFGTEMLSLVMAPRVPLEGELPRDLAWIIAIGGVALTFAGTYVALRLLIRRRRAERSAERFAQVASENRRMYAEQRGIAQMLQQALLPDQLPRVPGTETFGLYEASDRAVDIGGDFYDVIELDQERMLIVVGDVSGHGPRAATTMAQLRFAIRAYAAESNDAETILAKLTNLVPLDATGQLATILCTMVDARRRMLTVTSAGHLPPLLIQDGHAQFVECKVGLPIGVSQAEPYRSTAVLAGTAGTLVAYTDGLVERRGESLDVGLERLRSAAGGGMEPLEELLARLLEQPPRRQDDDIALLGVRWSW
jgi:serine phosphatase RsbU (regulator of sigma subunit)